MTWKRQEPKVALAGTSPAVDLFRVKHIAQPRLARGDCPAHIVGILEMVVAIEGLAILAGIGMLRRSSLP
ncbi:hypothetical protein ACW9UR_17060 [Halovulum sp. GXIMD14794]